MLALVLMVATAPAFAGEAVQMWACEMDDDATEEQVEATMVGGMYEVPLLSWRREVHDRMVGREGAWDAVVEGMMNVHMAGGHLTVVFVATRQNWKDLHATAQLAMMLGADELLYNRINVGAANLRLADELLRAGKAENDPLWRLPLWRPYESMLESKVADTNNVGGSQAGAITAALFIRQFVNAQSWVHFDLFAWTATAKSGRPEGGECQVARALYALLAARYG